MDNRTRDGRKLEWTSARDCLSIRKTDCEKLANSINSFCLEEIKADGRGVKKSARVAALPPWVLTSRWHNRVSIINLNRFYFNCLRYRVDNEFASPDLLPFEGRKIIPGIPRANEVDKLVRVVLDFLIACRIIAELPSFSSFTAALEAALKILDIFIIALKEPHAFSTNTLFAKRGI